MWRVPYWTSCDANMVFTMAKLIIFDNLLWGAISVWHINVGQKENVYWGVITVCHISVGQIDNVYWGVIG